MEQGELDFDFLLQNLVNFFFCKFQLVWIDVEEEKMKS